tara:strand:+ start:3491 stop:4468 length:978 start_codon:yes stop_codon:yes gene_type:complete
MKALVLGAGGFIGNHMVNRLVSEGYDVTGVDIKNPDFSESKSNKFILGDLTNQNLVEELFEKSKFDEIYQYAADMGGAGYIFTGDNDASVMYNSGIINLNILNSLLKFKQTETTKIFYSSSACVYPEHIQTESENPGLKESDAYPAAPDSEYGWEKLFSERLYLAFNKNFGLDVKVARFHNIYGPLGTWQGGKEKAPAAVCRKVALSESTNGEVEVWGDGLQTRSFLFIDDCIEATRRFMNSNHNGPINIGSEEMISINNLVLLVADIAQKNITIKNIDGPLGVRGRNSNNDLINNILDWNYQYSLREGMSRTYEWINNQASSST